MLDRSARHKCCTLLNIAIKQAPLFLSVGGGFWSSALFLREAAY